MRNLFFNHCAILFGLFILVSSCSSDDISEEQLKVTENFNYQKFYEDYKDEIHKLSREEFAGLNINLRIKALRDFSGEKKYDWWMEKLNNTMKLESLTKEQVDFITEVKGIFSPDFYKDGNEKKYDLADYIEVNAYKVGIDDGLIRKVFMEINDLDTGLRLINSSPISNLATPNSAKALRLDIDKIMVNYAKPISPISINESDCTNYGCIFCSPAGNGCTTSCNYLPNNCGIFSVFDCHAICL